MSQFTLDKKVILKGFAGYGAQFNHNVFAHVTRDLGITEHHLQALDQKVHRLGPRFVRIFFDPRALPGSSATPTTSCSRSSGRSSSRSRRRPRSTSPGREAARTIPTGT